MARTPLADRLQAISRRQFLTGAAGAVAASSLGWPRHARAAAAPRIVVVGAGLAGLTCTYRLSQAGVRAQLYEATQRPGGRCWSIHFRNGLVAEHGGELIDTGHIEIRQLAHELGLTLDDLHQGETNGTEPFYWFDGAPYTEDQLATDFNAIYQALHKDVSAASYPTTYKSFTPAGYDLDHISVAEWIDTRVPGGRASKLGQLLDVAYNIEYGAETTDQSSLNLLYLLGYSGQGQVRLFGPSNEKYHVSGGNDQIARALYAAVRDQVTFGAELVAIRRGASTYTLTFNVGGATTTVTADRVVLALPFSIMRASVDWSRAGFNDVKARAIRNLGMGTNSKLNVGFKTRYWRGLGCNGDTYADTGYQNTWEVSRAQPGTAGILVDYTGGVIGDSFGTGTPSSRAKQFLGQIEPLLPGIARQWDGTATVDYWHAYPWTKGSYSYWKVGQYTRFSGAEKERSGNCHFCGEHTSQDFQGYLNGGVETGERAAGEILGDLK